MRGVVAGGVDPVAEFAQSIISPDNVYSGPMEALDRTDAYWRAWSSQCAPAGEWSEAVVRSLVGHGVGRSYHEDPHIPNFGQPGRGPLLSEGMTIAIEPMITAGRPEVYVHDDEWSISTEDGSLAAHFEHTVAITASGPRILTVSGDRQPSLVRPT